VVVVLVEVEVVEGSDDENKVDCESELVALFPTSPNDSRSDELVGGFELSTASVAT